MKYKHSSILTVAYGKQPDGGIALGSLDLLDPQRKLEITAITAKAAEGMGEAEKETWSSLPHASFDLVIMNPPFTRPTGHEGKKIGVPNPMFAAFSSSAEEQRLMGKATKRLTDGTSAHGNAGEASIFLVLADRKLKSGGTLALVMPLSLMAGDAWEDSRALLIENYADMILVSIAGADGDLSFSADTGMGECLVVARKSDQGSKRATFVILSERPKLPMLGAGVANQILTLIAGKKLRRLEDGPVGASPIHFGDDVIGYALDAPLATTGGWNLSRVDDLSLAQAAYQITENTRIWLPGMNPSKKIKIPITRVGKIADIGPYHADINGRTSTGGLRGPFDVSLVKPGSAPTYPVLWAHAAEREYTLSFDGDSEGQPRTSTDPEEQVLILSKIANIVESASHAHFNVNFRFNSQATSMQFTPRPTIGGRAWLSLKLPKEKQEKALVLWANTSVGMLLHWWHANKQQDGRGNIGKSALEGMPVLDVTQLTPAQIIAAEKLFKQMHNRKFLPLHEIDKDSVRADLDAKFFTDVLGLPKSLSSKGGPLELLRMKLAREPSIRGHKSVTVEETE